MGKDVEKLNFHSLLMRLLNGTTALKNSLAVPQNIRHIVTIWPSNSIPRYMPKTNENHVHAENYTYVFTAAYFITAKRWKQPKCPLTDEHINKIWYIHTMEYYSAVKKNEILIHVAIWMNLENIMLHKRSQSQKTTYCMIPFIWKNPE